jgi:hypothetical protein
MPDPVVIPNRAADEEADEPVIESAGVREYIRDVYLERSFGNGWFALSELFAEIRRQGRLAIPSAARLHDIIDRVPELVVATGDTVVWIGDAHHSHLLGRVLQVVTVHRMPIHSPMLLGQLRRGTDRFQGITEALLLDLAAACPELRQEDGSIALAPGPELRPQDVIPDDELRVHTLLRGTVLPFTAEEINSRLSRRAAPSPELLGILQGSAVIVDVAPDRYEALTNLITRRTNATQAEHNEPEVPAIGPPRDVPTIFELMGESVRPIGTSEPSMVTLNDLLARIETGHLRIPEIQRNLVWKPVQVRDFFDSLYQGFPVGTVLICKSTTPLRSRPVNGGVDAPPVEGTTYLLDGQQRLTSLWRVLGSGEHQLLFHPESERFETATPVNQRMAAYVDVRRLVTEGTEAALQSPRFADHPNLPIIRERLERLAQIGTRQIHVDTLAGFSLAQVTDLFTRVNTKGTRLTSADLAIAHLAMQLPGIVSEHMTQYSEVLAKRGWTIDIQLLLRLLTAVATNRGASSHLATVPGDVVLAAWSRTTLAIEQWLDLLDRDLGLRPFQAVIGVNNHIVPVAWLAAQPDNRLESRLLEWFVHSLAWGRYGTSSGTALNQDLTDLMSRVRDPFTKLISRMRSDRPGLRVTARDLAGTPVTSGLAILSYLAAIRNDAADPFSDVPLRETLGATDDRIGTQPIFTKKVLGHGATASTVSELANQVFTMHRPGEDTKPREVISRLTVMTEENLRRHALPTAIDIGTSRTAQGYLKERRKLLLPEMNAVLEILGDGDIAGLLQVPDRNPTRNPVENP